MLAQSGRSGVLPVNEMAFEVEVLDYLLNEVCFFQSGGVNSRDSQRIWPIERPEQILVYG